LSWAETPVACCVLTKALLSEHKKSALIAASKLTLRRRWNCAVALDEPKKPVAQAPLRR